MTPSFTTLALNLLISEREHQRQFFLEKILDSKPLHRLFGKSPEFKRRFMSAMIACVEDPSSRASADFYEFAQLCDEELSGSAFISAA